MLSLQGQPQHVFSQLCVYFFLLEKRFSEMIAGCCFVSFFQFLHLLGGRHPINLLFFFLEQFVFLLLKEDLSSDLGIVGRVDPLVDLVAAQLKKLKEVRGFFDRVVC